MFYFSPSFFAAGWRGEAPEQTNSKRLFVPRRRKTHLHSFLPLSVYLLHTPSMSMSLSPVFGSQQCFISVPPRPTHQNTTTGRLELVPLSAPFIVPNTQSPLSHYSFLYLSLPHQRGLFFLFLQSPSSPPSISQIGDLTRRPHCSDFIRRQLQSRPQSRVSAEGGTISTAAASGTPPPLRGNFWKISTTSMRHLDLLKSASVNFICRQYQMKECPLVLSGK